MEPGINPIYVDLPDLVAKCVVQVVDCCTSVRPPTHFLGGEGKELAFFFWVLFIDGIGLPQDARFTVLDNAGVPAFLAKTRPSWSKVGFWTCCWSRRHSHPR